MAWILFALSFLSFVVLCYAKSVALGFICVVLTLGFMLAAVMKLMASRVDTGSRDGGRIITPEELRMYREQAMSKPVVKDPVAPKPAESTAPADNSSGPPSSPTT